MKSPRKARQMIAAKYDRKDARNARPLVITRRFANGKYPPRGFDIDQLVHWVGPFMPPIGGEFAIEGLDTWERT